MRLNLSLKFFIAFLVTSITIVVVMVGAMQFFARQNFTDYIHKVEAIRLGELSLVLQEEYRTNDGWKLLRNNPERWHKLLRPLGSAAYSEAPPAIPRGFESSLKAPPPLPPPPPGRPGFPGDDGLRDAPGRRPPPDEQDRPPRDERDRRPAQPPFGIEHRLALFDQSRQPVVGRAKSTAGHTLQEIAVNGKTVGWLGLRNEELPSDPLDTAFLKQQVRAFYLVGGLMLVLAAVVAFLLSRHLLAPVRELIKGTRSLTSRRFDARISVTTSDELGQLAENFNQMAQTLEQYEQLRRQWISDIAHELRTPLSILRGEIEALQDGIREASTQRLESLHAEVVHMSKIVSNLHDLSLAESAALHIKKEPVNLVRLVRSCLQKFQARFYERGISLVDELGDTEADTIPGDKDRLTQVFSNIMENTLRYTDGPGSLTVRQLCTASEMLLQFADTKPGVPQESLSRLFDRLYRVDPSRSREHGGSGLGLSICKTIIEAHKGTIKARHAATGGLLVEIMLPLQSKGQKHARKDTHGNGA
jgi:two-component system, OmpR family, sensor histidine kinase BaeS